MIFSLRVNLDEHHYDSLQTFFSKHCSRYVMAFEISARGNNHFHAVLTTEDTKSRFTKMLIDEFQLPPGNGAKSLTVVRDHDRAVTYVLKDGNFRFAGYPDSEIEAFRANSFQKVVFEEALGELEKEFLKIKRPGTYDLSNLISRRLALQYKCNRTWTKTSVNNWATFLFYKANTVEREGLARQMAANIFMDNQFNIYSDPRSSIDDAFDP